jgi:hypothetical protein
MTCAEIQRDAAGLASLPSDAPERRAAFEHARTCTVCAAALAEGETLMHLLAEALPLKAPQPEDLSRAKAEILAELSAEAWPAARDLATAPPPRSKPFEAAAAVMTAVTAAYLLATALGTKLPSDGRATVSLALALAAVLAGGVAILIGTFLPLIPVASFVASGLAAGSGGLELATGLRCLAIEGVLSLLPLTLAALMAWRAPLAHPSRTLMAAASGGALAGQAALHVLCHSQQSHAHLFVFHTGGVLVALALGAWVARLLPARRSASR